MSQYGLKSKAYGEDLTDKELQIEEVIIPRTRGQGPGCYGSLSVRLSFIGGASLSPWFTLFTEQVKKSIPVSRKIISPLRANLSETRVFWKFTCSTSGNLGAHGVLQPPMGKKPPILWEAEPGCSLSCWKKEEPSPASFQATWTFRQFCLLPHRSNKMRDWNTS